MLLARACVSVRGAHAVGGIRRRDCQVGREVIVVSFSDSIAIRLLLMEQVGVGNIDRGHAKEGER